MLYVYCFAVPAAIVLIVNLVFGPGKFARRLSLVNWSLLGVGKCYTAMENGQYLATFSYICRICPAIY